MANPTTHAFDLTGDVAVVSGAGSRIKGLYVTLVLILNMTD